MEYFLNKDKLTYLFDNRQFANSFEGEYDAVESPSIFYLNLKYEGETYLPISLFQNPLTPLQAIIKYLREILKLSNKQAAFLIGRDPRVAWAIYSQVKNKPSLILKESSLQVPLAIFKSNKLSIFESLVNFLKSLDFTYAQMARLLGKDQRTIWTIHHRAKHKLSPAKK